MDPDSWDLGKRAQVWRKLAEALRETFPILAVAEHLDKPIRERERENDGQKRAVNKVHGGMGILSLRGPLR